MEPLTIAAIVGAALWAASRLRRPQGGTVSGSTARISTTKGLDPTFAAKLSELQRRMSARGYKVRVWETLRTPERQAYLYEQGRSRPGAIVTNSRTVGAHGRGRAADLIDGRPHPGRPGQIVGWGSWKGGPRDEEAARMAQAFFSELGRQARALGLVWGGDWREINDQPHVELPKEG